LLHKSTVLAAAPIARAFLTEVVTANVGHSPSIRTKMGLRLTNPLTKVLVNLPAIVPHQ